MSDIQVLRIGKISSINYKNGTAKVTYEDRDGATTKEIPFIAWEYWMPRPADRVLVGHLSNGSTPAVILGPFWFDSNRPPEGAAGLRRKEYSHDPEQAYERFDEKTGRWTLHIGECSLEVNSDGSVYIMAPNGVTVNTPLMRVTGDVTAGSISLQGHTHTSSMPGTETSDSN